MSKTKVNVIDVDGDPMFDPQSAIERIIDIKGYNDLVLKIQALNVDDNIDFGDGKTFNANVSRLIWRTVIVGTKPLVAKNRMEDEELGKIYKLIYSFTSSGEYPLMQQLSNYLGLSSLNDFFSIISDSGHALQRVYLWAYNVFESAASMNAVRSNGNANIRKWLDQSREGKITAESRLELSIEKTKLDRAKEIGANIDRNLFKEEV